MNVSIRLQVWRLRRKEVGTERRRDTGTERSQRAQIKRDRGTERLHPIISPSLCPSVFLTHDHHGHAAFARFIEFDQEDSLPSPQLEASVGDIDADRHRQKEGFAMRMAVGWFIRRDAYAAA